MLITLGSERVNTSGLPKFEQQEERRNKTKETAYTHDSSDSSERFAYGFKTLTLRVEISCNP